jgi:general secretion pathway protein G
MTKAMQKRAFTLIEMLIVIIILGILAMIIIPQITVSTDDAKLRTLQTNLNTMRGAIELYAAQHGGSYPGPTAANFEQQLLRYTDATNAVSSTKTASAKYGPYIKGNALPTNPFNELSTVTVDATTADITARTSDGSTGWKFYYQTGVLMANDGAHDNL